MCFVETLKILVADARKLKKASNFDILQSILKSTVLVALQGHGTKLESCGVVMKLL